MRSPRLERAAEALAVLIAFTPVGAAAQSMMEPEVAWGRWMFLPVAFALFVVVFAVLLSSFYRNRRRGT